DLDRAMAAARPRDALRFSTCETDCGVIERCDLRRSWAVNPTAAASALQSSVEAIVSVLKGAESTPKGLPLRTITSAMSSLNRSRLGLLIREIHDRRSRFGR